MLLLVANEHRDIRLTNAKLLSLHQLYDVLWQVMHFRAYRGVDTALNT